MPSDRQEAAAPQFSENVPFGGGAIPVSKVSLGYAYELPLGTGPFRIAFGELASAYAYPDRVRPDYGDDGVKSAMLFARNRLAGMAAD